MRSLSLTLTALAPLCTGAPCTPSHSPTPTPTSETTLRLQHVMPNPDGTAHPHPWVELVQHGQSGTDLDGWRIARLDGTDTPIPALHLSPGDHARVVFGSGTDDRDLSDGLAVIFAPALTFDPSDAVGLYDPSGHLVDMLLWSDNTSVPRSGPTLFDGIAAGLWPAHKIVSTIRSEPHAPVDALFGGRILSRDGDADPVLIEPDLVWELAVGPTALFRPVDPADEVLLAPGFTTVAPKTWTVMTWVALDNNLGRYAAGNLDKIETALAGREDDVWAVTQVDTRISLGEAAASRPAGGTRSAPGMAFRGQLRADDDPDALTLYASGASTAAVDAMRLGEANMGDGTELADFIAWAKLHYPAEHYALVIDAHGANWKGVSSDDTTASGVEDVIQIGELGDALEGADLDLLVFNACNMGGVEVAYEVRDDVEVMVASEAIMWAGEFPYEALIAGTTAPDPGETHAEALGRRLVEASAHHWEHDVIVSDEVKRTGQQLSALRLGADFELLVDSLDDFSAAMGGLADTRNPAPQGGLDDTGLAYTRHGVVTDNVQYTLETGRVLAGDFHYAEDGFQRGPGDLVDLDTLIRKTNEQSYMPIDARYHFVEALNHLDRVIVANQMTGETYRDGDDASTARGLSIYFPLSQTEIDVEYDAFDHPTWTGSPWARGPSPSDPAVKYGPDLDPRDCKTDAEDFPLRNAPEFDFADEVLWVDALHRYYEPVADITCSEVEAFEGGSVTCSSAGSSTADHGALWFAWDLDGSVSTDASDVEEDCFDEVDDDADVWGDDVSVVLPAMGARTVVLTAGTTYGGHVEADQHPVTLLTHRYEVVPLDGVAIPGEATRVRISTECAGPVGESRCSEATKELIMWWPEGEASPWIVEDEHGLVDFEWADGELRILVTPDPSGGTDLTVWLEPGEDVDDDGLLRIDATLGAEGIAPSERQVALPFGVPDDSPED